MGFKSVDLGAFLQQLSKVILGKLPPKILTSFVQMRRVALDASGEFIPSFPSVASPLVKALQYRARDRYNQFPGRSSGVLLSDASV